VCGDIHGQYYDLLNIFSKNGYPSAETPYLFNGDFVDRGSFSVECILALYIYKLMEPNCVFLNRGNHEGRNMNKMYGFDGEVKAKYCNTTLDLWAHSFDYLTLCHVLNKKVFVVHGGLFAEDNVKLEDIAKIKRGRDIPDSGPFCDMLWSDPCKVNGRIPSKRGVSIQFGPDIAKTWLNANNLGTVI
jgi:serine/threonine-protein phosphatase 5